MIAVGPYHLRDYQQAAYQSIRGEFARHDWVLAVAPTGSGKTVMASAIMQAAKDKGKRVAFIVSGRQLVLQASRKLEECGIEHAVMMSGEHYWPSPITVASKDTYASWILGKGSVRELTPDLWIVDEADTAISEEWMRILGTGGKVLGLTATPITGNGKGLPRYESLCKLATYAELIENGSLVPVRCYSPSRPDLDGVGTTGSDYHQGNLATFMDRSELIGDVVQNYQRLGEDRPAVVFATNVAHSIHLSETFLEAGIPSEHIDASTPPDVRKAAFAAVERGDVQVLVNCAVLDRGFDLPALSCCVLAKPTKRLRAYMQMVGRVLRPHASKSDAVLIDHAGAVFEHGWPTNDHDWNLEDQDDVEASKDREESERPEREPYCCPQCACMWESGHKCPNCGFTHKKRGQPVTTIDGELREVKRSKTKTKKKGNREKEWMRSLAIAANRGGTVRSAMGIYKSRLGEWPEGLTPMPDRSERDIKVAVLYPGFVRRKKT